MLGLITFITGHFKPDLSFPTWVFWLFLAFAFITFLGANVKLFADNEAEKLLLQRRIDELEATEANISLKFVEAGFYPSHSGIPSPFPDIEIDQFGFDKRGLPGWASIRAKLLIKNTGYEDGELVWELDRAKTNLPPLFALDEEYDGEFDKGPLAWIGPRQKPFSVSWKLYVRIAEQDPHSFAQGIGSLDNYSVVLNYRTRRIDGESPQRSITITGDFQEFRAKVLEHWEWRHRDLADLAKTQQS
jgi:hypothetical protein